MNDVDRDGRIDWLGPTGRDGVRIGRRGAQLIVEWFGIGTLVAPTTDGEVHFLPDATVASARLEKFYATSLVACRRYLAGRISLHGSAVCFCSGAIVFVGQRGAGKSTTAMAFVENHGNAFLADDVAPIDWDGAVPMVAPVDDSIWLSRDSSVWFGLSPPLTEKRACAPRIRSTRPRRLTAIVELAFDDTTRDADLRLVTGKDSFNILSGAQICYSTGDDADTIRNFGARARLAGATKILRLRRRRSLETLSRVVQALTEHFSIPGPTGDLI